MNQKIPNAVRNQLEKAKLDEREQLVLDLICLTPSFVEGYFTWVQSSFSLNGKGEVTREELAGILSKLMELDVVFYDGKYYIPTSYSKLLTSKKVTLKYWHWPSHRAYAKEVLTIEVGPKKRGKRRYKDMGIAGKRIHNFKPLQWKKVPPTPKPQTMGEQMKKYKESLV